jgi:hypothetical protein
LRRTALLVALAVLAVAFFVVRPAPTAGPALRDFESYYAAGVAWGYQNDPYGRDVWRTERTLAGVVPARDELLPFVGPPFGLPLWHALGNLPWAQATLVWGIVLGGSLAAIAFGSLRLAGGRIDALDAVAVLVLAAGFGPLTSGVALGQVAVVSTAAIVLVPFCLRPKFLLAAGAATLVAALQPNLALVLAARLGGRRAALAFAGAAALAAGGSLLALGGHDGGRYLDVLRAHAAAERYLAIQTTPAAVARAFGASPRLAGALGIGLALVAVAGVTLQCASRRYRPDARLALACAALPLALPFAHEHDFTIAFLPALGAVRRARGLTWVVAAVALLGVAVDWLGLAQRPAGVPESVALTLAAAFALAVLARDRLRPYHFAPLAVALAAAAAGALVVRWPLPVWPDALGPDFHVPFSLSAAEVWHVEQVRSGIARLVPAWGALRLASLASCALVWLVASVALSEDATEPATLPRSEASSIPPELPQAAYPSDRGTW